MIEFLGTDDCLEVMREARNSHWVSYVIAKDMNLGTDTYNLASYIYIAIWPYTYIRMKGKVVVVMYVANHL